MKKLTNICLILVLLISFFIVPDSARAETLGDLERKLQKAIDEMKENENKENLTKEQIERAKASVASIRGQIEQIHTDTINLNNDIAKLNEEIEQLNDDIEVKNQELKDIINFVQVSNGESAYLEYMFGAKDFTDFIYRMAISEQLTKYNESLIDQYNEMIAKNEQNKKDIKKKQEDLAKKKTSLIQKQADLQKEISKLGTQLSEISDIKVSIEDDIKSQRDAIQFYKNIGCKSDEDIQTCGRDTLPPETQLWRPVVSGVVSSNYGNRCYNLNGSYVCDFHTGIDMAQSGSNVAVYSSGNGIVADTVRWSCGGNIVFINHMVNGTAYTTVYMHLRRILVSKGDIVTKDTQIGVMGGNPYTETWDSCSTGQHTHFMIAYGSYTGWTGVVNRLINPRSLVNFPAEDRWFSNRITRY